jgi:hypothetical protein
MGRLRFAFVLVLLVGCSQAEQEPVNVAATLPPPKIELGDVVCLKTAWYPQSAYEEDETENRIFREIVRQGVLLAVREEMCLVTRDETLGEQFPDIPADDGASGKQPAKALELWLELGEDGSWEARLSGAGTTYDNPVWSHKGAVKFNKRSIYAELAEQMANMSTEIAERLRAAGGKGEAEKLNPTNVPDEDIEKLLGEMNFVSQYAAVRAAHRATAEQGASLEWVGVLARGYAHLALLTDHTWASHSEAFAARSLLYAERMMELGESNELAQWHRAYALAVIGAHGAALGKLGELEKLKSDDDEERPHWANLVEPYVKFEHDNLDQVANDHSELAETVAFLQWHLYRSYQHIPWIYKKGLDAMQACPEAYGVYSVMAGCDALRVKRTGSGAGAAAFGELLPRRVAALNNLPESLKQFTAQQGGFLSKLMGRKQDTMFSNRPLKIAHELMTAAKTEPKKSECSWAILGQMIAEEQFVEAADMLVVAMDSVEHSQGELLDRLLPLVEGHRYAPYIKSYAYSPNEQPIAELARQIKVVDPNGNMVEFFYRIWNMPTADGQNGQALARRAIWSRTLTLGGLMEAYYGLADKWTRDIVQEHRELFASNFAEVSPMSPNACRLPYETGKIYQHTELADAEKTMKADPIGWRSLGSQYFAQKSYEDAARCFQHSLKISPSEDVTHRLANSYKKLDKMDLWESTLESFLKEEDLGLTHAGIHRAIAEENIRKRAWHKAEPHALVAAETYSSWGLLLASQAYEGMQDWTKSEYYAAESTRSYPSNNSGLDWYFWCCRTGRGDLETARKYAAQSAALLGRRVPNIDDYYLVTYHLLEKNPAAALDVLDRQMGAYTARLSVWTDIWRKFQIIIACEESSNAERKANTIAELRAIVARSFGSEHANWNEAFEGVCQLFEGRDVPEEFFANFDATVAQGSEIYRCDYNYFIGTALEQLSKHELADKYLRLSAFGGPFGQYTSTLAGHRLAERHGPERSGLPAEFAEIEAKLAEEAEAKATAKVKAEAGDDDDTI